MAKLIEKVKKDNEIAAKKGLLEELFHDLYRGRLEIYKLNFVRGIFFGFGSVLGGTIVVALIIWILSLFTNLPGGVGHFVQDVINSMRQSK